MSERNSIPYNGNLPPGCSDNDPHFDLPSVGDEEVPTCAECGDSLDEDRDQVGICLDCENAAKQEEAEREYWAEVNRTAWVTSQYNDGREGR